MDSTFAAVYEEGVLRPLEPLPAGLFEEGEHLTCVFDDERETATLYRLPNFEEKSEGPKVNLNVSHP